MVNITFEIQLSEKFRASMRKLEHQLRGLRHAAGSLRDSAHYMARVFGKWAVDNENRHLKRVANRMMLHEQRKASGKRRRRRKAIW